MLKSELIEKIAAQNPHLYRYGAGKIVNTINPRDGTKVAVPEKLILAFKSSRDMHRRLNPSEE